MVTRSTEDISTMTAQIFNASKEQASAAKNILKHVQSIEEMTQSMVKATNAQVHDGADIEKSMVSHVAMVEVIFDVMEKRQADSLEVIREMELMKGES